MTRARDTADQINRINSSAADATAITVDSSENVAITGNLSVDGGTNTYIDLDKDDAGIAQIRFYNEGSFKFAGWLESDENFHHYGITGVQQIFSTNGSEAMRINNSGNIFIKTTAEPSASQTGVRISGSDGLNFWKSSNSGTSGYDQLAFFNGNGLVGTISTSGSATAYNTSSDYRLKENVVYTWDATTRIKQLKPARFNFIADDTNTPVDGFLAHEAQAVVPESVTGTKDEVDADGNAIMQGIDQSKLVPLLVKTIQELEARITALEKA